MDERTAEQPVEQPGADGLVLALVAAWAQAQGPSSAEQVRALAESRRVGAPVARRHLSA